MVRLCNGGVGHERFGISACIEAIESQRQQITALHGVSCECGKRITAGHAGFGNDFPGEVLPGPFECAANAIALADQGISFGECRRCWTRKARDRQRAADIRVVVAATEAGQTCRGILVEHLHVVTAKTGFDAFAIHSMVYPCDGYDACSSQQADPCRSAGGH